MSDDKDKDKSTVHDDLFDIMDTNKDGQVDTGEAVQYIFYSRTIWVNIIALLAIMIQQKYGFVVSAAFQMEILTILNFILRVVTKKPLTFHHQ